MPKVEKYMKLAKEIAEIFSKDPSTKVGAVIVGTKPNLVCFGYNGFPPGIEDNNERLNNRELKYPRVVHAERNALDNCTFEPHTLFVTKYPCHECAKSIITKRIEVVYAPDYNRDSNDRWSESNKLAEELFKESYKNNGYPIVHIYEKK